jgi:maleylacetoacetate isomerase
VKLYNYFRSSASFRVRIAMNLKGLSYEYAPVHLVKNEHFAPHFRALNPEALVPVLLEDGAAMTQSLAICEYLEEMYPEPPLLPADALGRSRVRALALTIACEIHPLNNLRVLRYLVKDLGVAEDAKDRWYRHWVETGLAAFEAQLDHTASGASFCHGTGPTLADICLAPQIFNAQRFNCDLSHVPRALRAYEACMKLEAFQRAAPGEQPDAA